MRKKYTKEFKLDAISLVAEQNYTRLARIIHEYIKQKPLV